MPDIHMQQQIDALREAFSADIRKPFVLKPSFPYGSPIATSNRTPPRGIQYRPQLRRTSSMEQHQALEQQNLSQHQSQVGYTSHPISPPVSAGSGMDNKSDSPAVQSLVMMATGQRGQQPISNAVPMVDPSAWNPNRIFDQWNTSFGANHEPLLPEAIPPPNSSLPPAGSQPMPPTQYSSAPIPSFVSPSMWQESVASVYEGGLKRQWDYEGSAINHLAKRPR